MFEVLVVEVLLALVGLALLVPAAEADPEPDLDLEPDLLEKVEVGFRRWLAVGAVAAAAELAEEVR